MSQSTLLWHQPNHSHSACKYVKQFATLPAICLLASHFAGFVLAALMALVNCIFFGRVIDKPRSELTATPLGNEMKWNAMRCDGMLCGYDDARQWQAMRCDAMARDAMRTRTRHSDVSATTATKRYLTKVTGETAGEDSAEENWEMGMGWGTGAEN